MTDTFCRAGFVKLMVQSILMPVLAPCSQLRYLMSSMVFLLIMDISIVLQCFEACITSFKSFDGVVSVFRWSEAKSWTQSSILGATIDLMILIPLM